MQLIKITLSMPNDSFVYHNGTNFINTNFSSKTREVVIKTMNSGAGTNFLDLNGNTYNTRIRNDLYLSNDSVISLGNPNSSSGHNEIVNQITNLENIFGIVNVKLGYTNSYYSF